jgi:hypothetical protein
MLPLENESTHIDQSEGAKTYEVDRFSWRAAADIERMVKVVGRGRFRIR